MDNIENLTYGQLKEKGKTLGLSVTGKSLSALRTEVLAAMSTAAASGTATEPAKERPATKPTVAPQPPATKVLPEEGIKEAGNVDSPATTVTETDEAKASREALEARSKELQEELAALKAQGEELKKAKKEISKQARAADKNAKKSEADKKRDEERAAKKAEADAKRAQAKIDREAELKVTYAKGERAQVKKGSETVTADVVATDIYDSRSGFSFYRFRRVLVDPNNVAVEVPGGYFFKRNYNIPAKDVKATAEAEA